MDQYYFMWLYLHYVYPLVHAGAVPVGGVVGAIISVISVTIISVVITIAVALVIARKRKAKKCGTCDLKATAEQKSGANDHTGSSVADQETGGIAKDGCVIGDSYTCIGRQQSKVDLIRGDTAGGVEPHETTTAFRDDASTRHDHVCGAHTIPML